MGASRGKKSGNSTLWFVMVACLLLAACQSTPTLPATSVPAATRTESPPPMTEPSPTPPPTPSPSGPVLPDPKSDPLGALLYSDFPASLGRAGFTASFLLTADPEESYGYGVETARSFGTFEVIDYAAEKIDSEMHINFSIWTYNQDLHVVLLGDRAWARWYTLLWEEIDRVELVSADMERLLWGGWNPVNVLEPFDSVTQAEWVEDGLLGGTPAHHLHVVFDPDQMRTLIPTAKARYEYHYTGLLSGVEDYRRYGEPTAVDVQAEVWLAAEDLAVRQIDMRIDIITQDDADQISWTILRTVQFDTVEPIAIASPVLVAAGAGATDCILVTEISEAECRALVTLYEETGGETWTNVEGWLVGNQPCSWGGVTCRGGHVVWLMLQEIGMTGALPAAMSDLQWLQVLSLSNNKLSGAIPPELGTLGDLQVLDLQFNGLSGLVPAELGSLHNLQELNLALTPLAGSLPETFLDLRLISLDIDATGICVPDLPSFRDWVEQVTVFGMGTQHEGIESVFCPQQPALDATGTLEAITPSPTP